MKQLKTAFLIGITLLSFPGYCQVEFYVSSGGSDSNQGTLGQPFKTISHAQKAVRDVKDKSKEDINVYLRGGIYQITEMIRFDQDDGGDKNQNITYQAYEDESPVISGGVRVNNWQPCKNGIWKAPAKGFVFRQLYINGERAIRSRTPNVGTLYEGLMWDVAEEEILLDGRLIRTWDNPDDVELIVYMNWAEAIMRFESVKFSNDEPYTWHTPRHAKVTVQQPERGLIFKRDHPPKRNEQAWYLENAMEFIDQPGEWYLNEGTDTIFYLPRKGEDMESANVIVPRVETLLEVKGTLDRPVKNLHFKGLTFQYSTWLKPSIEGALNIQACNYNIKPTEGNQQYVERIKAAAYMAAAHHCSFEGNTFKNLGASGLDLHYGTLKCSVKANLFDNIAATGIQVAKFSDPDVEMHIPYNPEDKRELSLQDVISNNLITNIGLDYTGAIGIACGYPTEILIEHNEIGSTPYSGISVGWGWRYDDNAMHSNVIRKNYIHNVCQKMCDCGGIYTLAAQPDSKIIENHIKGVEHAPWAGHTQNVGIYLDEGTRGFLVERNVLQDLADRRPSVLKGESVYKHNYKTIPEVVKEAGIQPEYLGIINSLKSRIGE